jgi:hypothetical protein
LAATAIIKASKDGEKEQVYNVVLYSLQEWINQNVRLNNNNNYDYD